MFSYIQSIILTIALAFLLRFYVIQPFIVEGSSMEPNFHDREYIVIDKASYHIRVPKRGEVIVFHPPTAQSENYIKRIIGLPGDTVEVNKGDIMVNGTKLDETYLGDEDHKTEPIRMTGSVTLNPDEYFVLGDNREHSSDSREWGPLRKENIEGRTWFIALPLNNFQFISPPSYALSLSWLIGPHIS